MKDSLVVLSDIHGNLSALNAVISDFECRYPQINRIAVLGDIINYGMRPNAVIDRLRELADKYKILVNLYGNHEKALLDGDTRRFSTDRGRQVLGVTRNMLTADSIDYLHILNSNGYEDLEISGKNILFVHGSGEDPFWGKLKEDSVRDTRYSKFDYVISGHSHIPHLIENFYPADRPEFRNKKRTIFLNPGSVGQPRNHNPHAQYLYIDFVTETFHFNSVEYDIKTEQALYTNEIDKFYSERLTNGI